MTANAPPASTASVPPLRFSRIRFAFLVLIGVYPVITALLYGVSALTEDWAIWQRTLLVAPTMVATVVWVVIPIVHARFRRFLHRAN